ncbi:hypothetical protein IMG5_055070 [Ichthyophthirius multifiliis]|uniref:Transmembrane protein n=1 Tax=Ichthyophthirius multifiliis TaxID=5932 RepID=G0QN35_ICHMU|nr:hypothetical protein IMG5_055070 [Ichthyophthirius multifiliis]EGR33364.1 hypothetical protein IMG5_055070 [Ichthyophthirius multifiliis]|eukprot:XP_004037350.1 hypothetical protein IMG5_055070 [Ichthyophthirius multifiliis]
MEKMFLKYKQMLLNKEKKLLLLMIFQLLVVLHMLLLNLWKKSEGKLKLLHFFMKLKAQMDARDYKIIIQLLFIPNDQFQIIQQILMYLHFCFNNLFTKLN